jgi:hypothetical protein
MRSGSGACRRAAIGGALVLVGAGLCVIGLRARHLELSSLQRAAWKEVLAVVTGTVLLVSGAPLLASLIERRHFRRQRMVPFLIALAVYGGVYAVKSDQLPPRGDEPHYMLEAYSLAIDGDRNLAADYVTHKRIAPMFGRFAPNTHTYNYTGDPDVAISTHSVGLPALLVPAAALSDDTRLMRIEMLLVAAAAAYLLLSILRRVAGGSSLLVYGTWAGFAFSLPLISYSSQIYAEMPGALLVLLVVRLLLEPEPTPRRTVLAASAAALLPWLHVRFTFLSVALGGAVLIRALRAGGPHSVGPRVWPRRVLSALGPLLVSAVLLGLADQHWYGSPWPTAPFRLARPRPHLDAAWGYTHSVGGIFDSNYGWLPFAPLHLLAFVGLVYFCWRGRKWALAGGALSLTYLLIVVSARGIEGGFAFPARLELVLIPLGAVPVLLLLMELRAMALLAVPLAALTFALSAVGVARIEGLIYSAGYTDPNTLPLAGSLAPAWPRLQVGMVEERYRDWHKVLVWTGGIVFVGSILALGARVRRPPDPAPIPVSVGSE